MRKALRKDLNSLNTSLPAVSGRPSRSSKVYPFASAVTHGRREPSHGAKKSLLRQWDLSPDSSDALVESVAGRQRKARNQLIPSRSLGRVFVPKLQTSAWAHAHGWGAHAFVAHPHGTTPLSLYTHNPGSRKPPVNRYVYRCDDELTLQTMTAARRRAHDVTRTGSGNAILRRNRLELATSHES